MKILFLAHRLPYPPNKGDKIRSFWELKTMSANHEVDLFSFFDDPQDKVQIANLNRYCRRYYAEPISILGSRFRAVSSLVRGQPFSTAFFYSTNMARRIREAVRSRSYDVAFVFGSPMAQYVEPWKHLPKILDMVDVDSDKWTQYSGRSRGPLSRLWKLEGRKLEAYESHLVRSFTNTLVCTEAESHLLRSKAPTGRIDVLQNHLDVEYYRPESISVSDEIRSWQPYVIFTGTMDYFPNIDAVQYFCNEILPKVRSRVPRISFVIAGRKPSAQVIRLATDTGIHVTGTVSDIRPYLQGAAVAVAPIRIARGVQNKILEALAMDVPVVASSAAAAALPRELAFLLSAESDPELLADRVVDYVLASLPRTGAIRNGVKQYANGLDLSSQLERFLCAAAREGSNRTANNQVEVAV